MSDIAAVGDGGTADGTIGAATPAATAEDWDGRAWRRFGARYIDRMLFALLISIAIGVLVAIVAPDALYWLEGAGAIADLLIFTPVLLILSIPIQAACLAWWGRTPGKFLFGVRVTGAGGGNLSYTQALKREVQVVVFGLGLGLPLITLFTMMNGYNALENEHVTPWDASVAAEVGGRAATGWQLFGVAVGTVSVILLLLLNSFMMVAGA